MRLLNQISLTLFITLVLTTQALSQKNTLSGRIIDKEGKPIEYATIQVDGSSLGCITNADGRFIVRNVPIGKNTVTISHVGFLSVKQSVEALSDIEIILEEDLHNLPQLLIIGQRDHLFTKTPGSVAYLDKDELTRIKPISGNEVFRRVTGLNVVDEEGAGLRVNIGIRGLDPDRSRNVLMLEDGIPVALNPYGEPEMYYTPAIDRMSGVEVLKGSGQILYGPQTVGGVINYITADPPQDEEFRFRVQGGKGSFLSALGSYGNTFNKTGVQLNYLHKRADALGAVNFVVNDFTTKLKFPISEKATLGLKLAAYNETSNSTYIGITQAMYNNGGNDFSVLVPNDELSVKRYLMSLSHSYSPSAAFTMQSTLFAYTTTRNWRRQDYAYNSYTGENLNPPPADWTGVTWGDESVPGGAIYLRNRTGNRDRQFEVAGWEQKVTYNHSLGFATNELTAGYRMLYERAYEQRINGSSATAKSGTLVSDEIRTGKALAIYVLDKITFSDKVDVTPGVRMEIYNYERHVLRDASVDMNKVADNRIHEFIPGIGFNYRPATSLNIFSGIHRGYAPPRIKDAIDFALENPVLQLEAERSWNMELGIRATPVRGLNGEVTYFYMDFDNQIIPSSQSVGGSGFGLTNAGRTLHQGLEVSVNANSREVFNSKWLVLLDANNTFINATYNSDRLVGNENKNVKGNRLPYAPNFTLSTALSIEAPFGTGVRITNTYVGNQFADELNTVTPSNNGRIGEIESYYLLDATLYHKLSKLNASFNLSVKNLTDERYISTRRPEGIRVGLPRLITAGFEIKF
jgi:Fe(3+) dicitrate transport protein